MVEIDRIYSLAKEKGLSNSFLCKKMNRSTSYLNDARNGKHGISESDLEVIAEILNTTPEYLHGKTDVKEKTTLVSEGGLTEDELKWLNIWRSFTQQEKERYLVLFSAAHQE